MSSDMELELEESDCDCCMVDGDGPPDNDEVDEVGDGACWCTGDTSLTLFSYFWLKITQFNSLIVDVDLWVLTLLLVRQVALEN